MNEQAGNENEAMRDFADALWTKFLKQKVRDEMQNTVSYFRAQVVTAPANGVVVVQRPFDTATMSLPYVSSLENLAVGSQVTVMVMGSHSNAIVMGDGVFSNL